MPSTAVDGGQKAAQKRLLNGITAAALWPILSIVTQVATVPLLLQTWGSELYGTWVLLNAVPTYLALSDVGFGTVAANDMTMRVSAGDREGALVVFQSSWLLTTGLTVTAALIVAIGCFVAPNRLYANVSQLSPGEIKTILIALALNVLIGMQTNVISSGFRCNGRFALGTVLTTSARLLETLAVITVALLHQTPVYAALACAATKLITVPILGFSMVRATPWLSFGASHASFTTIRLLARPAIAFMAFPAADALNLQGVILVIGATLGPVAVGEFSTLRTLTRFSLMCVEALKAAFWPELSAAFGASDRQLARDLHRRACQSTILASAIATAGLGFLGPMVYSLWTKGKLTFQPTVFFFLIVIAGVNSLWRMSSVVTMATNRHEKCSLALLASAVLSVLLSIPAMTAFDELGVCYALLACDAALTYYVVRLSLAELDDSPGAFLRALLDLKPALALARRLT